jgi:hypothetical protein
VDDSRRRIGEPRPSRRSRSPRTARRVANYTDLWWNPQESGWGVNLNHQGDRALRDVVHLRQPTAQGMWLVMSDARRRPTAATRAPIVSGDGRAARADQRTRRGEPAATRGGQRTVPLRARRSAARSAYTLNGVQQQKAIERQGLRRSHDGMRRRRQARRPHELPGPLVESRRAGWGNQPEPPGRGDLRDLVHLWARTGAASGWCIRRAPPGHRRVHRRLYRTARHGLRSHFRRRRYPGSRRTSGSVRLILHRRRARPPRLHVDGVSQGKPITRQTFARGTPLCK